MKSSRWVATACFLLILFGAFCVYRYPLWLDDEDIRYHLWRSHVRSGYVEADGYRLHYFEAGPSNGSPGIPLILIHGLGSRGEDWSPMIPTLAASGFHVYAPDLLGYGRSAMPDVSYSIAAEEDVVAAFMKAKGISSADVAGWSMGGWVASKLALDHPQLVDRLVLYDSAGLTFAPAFGREAFVPTDATSLHQLVTLLTARQPSIPGFVAQATLRKVRSTGWIVQRNVDSMEAGNDLLDTRLTQIRQPTLIVWGSDDRLIPIAVGETMHHDIANSRFVAIPGCGHLAPGECARPVIQATLSFLKAPAEHSAGSPAAAELDTMHTATPGSLRRDIH